MEIKEKIMEHTKEVEDIIVKFLPAEEGLLNTAVASSPIGSEQVRSPISVYSFAV